MQVLLVCVCDSEYLGVSALIICVPLKCGVASSRHAGGPCSCFKYFVNQPITQTSHSFILQEKKDLFVQLKRKEAEMDALGVEVVGELRAQLKGKRARLEREQSNEFHQRDHT